MWYELWDMSLEMLLDEGDDPTLVLELLRELIDELEPDDLDDLMLVERHPALQAESFSHGANVITQLEKRVAARERRQGA